MIGVIRVSAVDALLGGGGVIDKNLYDPRRTTLPEFPG